MQAHPHERPAVAVFLVEIQADAFVIFGRGGGVGEGLCICREIAYHPLAQRLEVAVLFKADARLFRLFRLGQVFDEIGQLPARPALFCKGDEQPRHEIGAVVEKIVLFEGGVPARLYGERRVFAGGVPPHGFVDDVFVPALVAAVLSAPALDEFRQAVARDRVGDDGARLFREQNRRDEGDQPVAVDLFAVFVHGARPVHVRIEDDAEVRLVFLHGFADRAHRLFVFGIGDMSREHSVRVEILRARRVRAEGNEHFVRVKSARAVARVHENALAFQRLPFPRRRPHLFHQRRRIRGEEGSPLPFPRRRFGEGLFRRAGEDLLHLFAAQSAVGREEFQPVAVEGEMAGGDHDRTVAAEIALFEEHEHGGGGGQAGVDRLSAHLLNAAKRRFRKRLRGDAGIVSHRDADLFFARFCPQPQAERRGDVFRPPGREVYVFARDALRSDAAHVRAVSQGEIIP